MSEPIFYVYEHWRPDRGECFYVGKGKAQRAHNMRQRNRYHKFVQKKLNRLGLCVEVKIVADGLEESEAFGLERERIAFWRADGADLVNLTDGGDGGSKPCEETRELMRQAKLGRKLSDEHKTKLSEASRRVAQDPAYKARLSQAIRVSHARPEVREKLSKFQKTRVRSKEHYENVSKALMGRKLSPEHAEKARNASKGFKQSPETIEKRTAKLRGRKRSEEFREQMKDMWSDERKAKLRAEKSIAVICENNGVVYESAREAAKALSVDPSMVSKVCRKKFLATKGYSFSYANEVKVK